MSSKVSMNLDTEDSTWPSRPRLGITITAPSYTTTYPDSCAGLDVTITNLDGDVIDTDTLTEDTPVVHAIAPEGELQGLIGTVEIEDAPTVKRAYDLVVASIADVPGASETETAHLIATGSGVTDGADNDATLIADPAYDLPSWCTVADNAATVESAALNIAGSVAAFTANFPTTVPGGGDGWVAFYCDSYRSDAPSEVAFGTDYFETAGGESDFDVQTDPFMHAPLFDPAGETYTFIFHGEAYESDGATPVEDGTYEGTCYIQIRRDMAAPTVPA